MNALPTPDFNNEMKVYSGDDLLNVFKLLEVDLGKLNKTVIRAWFDSDCKKTLNLLNWLCESISRINYVSPLEQSEFDELANHLDIKTCIEQLTELDFGYVDVLNPTENDSEIRLNEEEILMLKEENKTLDQLLKTYENLDNNLATELTLETKKDIQCNVECKKVQEECVELCHSLDETITKIQTRILKYDPDQHFLCFLDSKYLQENIEYFKSYLVPRMEIDKTCLETSDDAFTDTLESCKKRLLHSHQILFCNKTEIDSFKELDHVLDKWISSDFSSINFTYDKANLETSEIYKTRLFDVLDNLIIRKTDKYLGQARIRYVQSELEDYQQKLNKLSDMLGCAAKCLSYYSLANCLLLEDKNDIEYINSFYQKIFKYINEDLFHCEQRTEQMQHIARKYEENANSAPTLMTYIAKILGTSECSLQETYQLLEKFKGELNGLENQIFCINIKNEMERIENLKKDVDILGQFLRCGPTHRIIFVPKELENVWLDIECHIKKESDSVQHAVRAPQLILKKLTKAQISLKQLWMCFLTNLPKIDDMMKQAEDEFNKRTAQYF